MTDPRNIGSIALLAMSMLLAGSALLPARSESTGTVTPVIRSAIAIPAFCGPPPGRSSRSPVTLMKPPMPWMMKS